MTAKTRFRLLLWPVLLVLLALGWWGLISIGVPWWAVPVGVLAFIGVLGLVGWWIGALENAREDVKREQAGAALDDADDRWDNEARRLFEEGRTDEARQRLLEDDPDGNA